VKIFNVEDRVTIMGTTLVGMITTIGRFDKNGDVVKYYVEFITSEKSVEGRWFESYQLKKVSK